MEEFFYFLRERNIYGSIYFLKIYERNEMHGLTFWNLEEDLKMNDETPLLFKNLRKSQKCTMDDLSCFWNPVYGILNGIKFENILKSAWTIEI